MTTMRERRSQRQYLAAAFAAACSSNGDRKSLSQQGQERLSSEGSPP
ncbi:hypothetical protein [Amycolatopsis taiwanensis]|nr:hypothetical protein [Amycolatopsis taiwanensis]